MSFFKKVEQTVGYSKNFSRTAPKFFFKVKGKFNKLKQ